MDDFYSPTKDDESDSHSREPIDLLADEDLEQGEEEPLNLKDDEEEDKADEETDFLNTFTSIQYEDR